MTHLAEHLSCLRQEIADLQNKNTPKQSPLGQSALELRTLRLLQIKKELAYMLTQPNDPKIWWDNVRKPNAA